MALTLLDQSEFKELISTIGDRAVVRNILCNIEKVHSLSVCLYLSQFYCHITIQEAEPKGSRFTKAPDEVSKESLKSNDISIGLIFTATKEMLGSVLIIIIAIEYQIYHLCQCGPEPLNSHPLYNGGRGGWRGDVLYAWPLISMCSCYSEKTYIQCHTIICSMKAAQK